MSGLYNDGTIKIRQSDLLKISDSASFMETTYHEFVHNQQDGLVMRSVLDYVEKQTGAHLQPQDIDRMRQLEKQLSETHALPADQLDELTRIKKEVNDVREAYKEKSGRDFSDDHLKEVIRARDGHPLSLEERLRAHQLGDAFKNMANPGEAFVKAGNYLAVVTTELQKLQQPGGAKYLVRRLSANDPELSRRLFDSSVPPPEVQELINQYSRDGRLTNLEASNTLKELLERQHRVLDAYHGALYREYIAGFHEQEAWIIGETVDHAAREQGMGPKVAEHPPYSTELPPNAPPEAGSPSIKLEAPAARDKVISPSFSPEDADKYLRIVEEGRESAKNSDLSKPRVMDSHLDRVETTVKDWKDQSELITRADESYSTMRDTHAKYRNEVIDKLRGKVPEGELRSVDSVRKLIAGDAEKLALLDEYVAARRANSETQKALVAAVKERTADIQKMMDQLADAEGIPHVKVRLTADGRLGEGTHGQFNHYDGTLELRRSDFMGNNLSTSDLNTMYHEFVHNEQSALIIQNIAEDLKVSKDLTPSEVEQVRNEFKKRIDSDVSPERIDEVMGGSRRKDIQEIAAELNIEGGKGRVPSSGDIIRIHDEYAKAVRPRYFFAADKGRT